MESYERSNESILFNQGGFFPFNVCPGLLMYPEASSITSKFLMKYWNIPVDWNNIGQIVDKDQCEHKRTVPEECFCNKTYSITAHGIK